MKKIKFLAVLAIVLFTSHAQAEESCATTSITFENIAKTSGVITDDLLRLSTGSSGHVFVEVRIIYNGRVVLTKTGCESTYCEWSVKELAVGSYLIEAIQQDSSGNKSILRVTRTIQR